MPNEFDSMPLIRRTAAIAFSAGMLAALAVAFLMLRVDNEPAESLVKENEALREKNQRLETERGKAPGVLEKGDGLLVQTGEIHPANKPAEFDVYYPRPFTATPRLTIKNRGTDLICYELLYQRPDGFRLRVEAAAAAGEPATYEARGLPAADG